MIEYTETGDARYVPSDDDFADFYGDDEEWDICEFCGEEKPVGFACDCQMGVDDGDFPLYMEYEGVYGLSGYDSFYDNDSDLGREW